MQLCAEAGAVVTTGVGVCMGDTVTTGGFPAVHPLTIMKPAMTSRRMHNKPEVFPAMVPDITGDMIIIWGNYDSVEMFLKKPERTTGVSPPPLWLPPNAIPPEQVLHHHRFLSAGAVRGDRHCPLLRPTCAFNFIP
jgi:hypothetical protein